MTLRPELPASQRRLAAQTRDRVARLERYPQLTIVQIQVTSEEDTLATGNGQGVFWITEDLNGLSLLKVEAFLGTPSSSGVVTLMIRNRTRGADMLTTSVTIPVGQQNSYPPATPNVIDELNDDVTSGDAIVVDVDVAGTGAEGLAVAYTFGGA